jgi:hypothetical protein
MQGFDGSDPNHPAGIASTAGAPAPAKIWTFAEGLVNDATNDRYTLQNPNDAPANVELDVVLDTPATNGSVDPITAVVPAHGYAQVSMHDETRVPHDVGHSVTARVTNGVPIVVERVITAVPPAPRRGYTPSLGSPLVASQWVVPDGRAVAGTVAEFLVIVNPSPDTIAHVDIGALAQGQLLAIDGLQNVEVAAGGRLSIDLGQHVNREDLPIIVTADAPIVVERGLYAANANGISVSTGVPLTETAAVPKVKAASTTSTTAVTFPQSS